GPAFFVQELQLPDSRALRIDDTATIAAAGWLQRARRHGMDWLDPERCRRQWDRWSGQWLHAYRRPDDEEDRCPDEVWAQIRQARDQIGWPPAYYAVLMLDGDHMGLWLRGEKSPRVREVLHPKLCGYFESLAGARQPLDAPRPVTPALHAAISEALANFALHFVPPIVERHGGTLIYAGGDDVLALLPAARALACAEELNQTFRCDWKEDADGRLRLLMGRRATVSAGLAVVHHKEDLRFALEQARRAEKQAKEAGRAALVIRACRRSGEHTSVLCPWEFVGQVQAWSEVFGNRNASDRWAYHLRAELETLQSLPPEAMEAEIRRQVERAEPATKDALRSSSDAAPAGDQLAGAFRRYRQLVAPDGSPRFPDAGQALRDFIGLCQTASFLARGKDAS
ncbi:MAG TPA: type III-B CRISPR-associated protein Cas10/Cmr2, partial [Planctomycetaceae bacterium]|nr:type III-B CRISPR-associated protein Cas10/Cmr2 [Planctomycetaceae bacterium]